MASLPLRALEGILAPERVATDAGTLGVWGVDWTRSFTAAPSAVVFPESVVELVRLTELANAEGLALVPSGGRTGLSGGAVAAAGEIVVSFDRMNRILAFDPVDRLVRCQAGVVTAALQQYARERGLFYPVDFGSSGSSQIGGNIATNAGGIRVIRYGLTRDWIAGLKVVTGSGAVLDCNNGLVKNATGYDLRHLFIGSEGTLGFVAEAQLRLREPPPPQRVMLLGLCALAAILPVLRAFQAVAAPSAFEFFSESALAHVLAHRGAQRPLARGTPFYALVEFDAEAEEAAFDVFQEAVENQWAEDGVISRSEAQAASLWALREGITEGISRFSPYKNDLSVRVSEVPNFLEEIDRIVDARCRGFEVCWHGHIGDGNLHFNILKPERFPAGEFLDQCRRLAPTVFAAVRKRGGSISAEHGVGLLKRDFLDFSRSPQEIGLMRGVKKVFDPNGVMNPGKLLPA